MVPILNKTLLLIHNSLQFYLASWSSLGLYTTVTVLPKNIIRTTICTLYTADEKFICVQDLSYFTFDVSS